ncbi:hypothetical protein M5D96_011147 [Drosophila gunungcola]|uniref:Par3/HAL N-terminal domain-containing protein n=1 Tax=Drosophila gunungcola TaxID=103775 RepID=A0A9P9YGA6_9MUSC|nr:hypothetical protein M5D96_011147 [Drosophila gunungcola]
MKVTVCFGDVRILVPCGSGELLVSDLVKEATRRYIKAAGKVGDLSYIIPLISIMIISINLL